MARSSPSPSLRLELPKAAGSSVSLAKRRRFAASRVTPPVTDEASRVSDELYYAVRPMLAVAFRQDSTPVRVHRRRALPRKHCALGTQPHRKKARQEPAAVVDSPRVATGAWTCFQIRCLAQT